MDTKKHHELLKRCKVCGCFKGVHSISNLHCPKYVKEHKVFDEFIKYPYISGHWDKNKTYEEI